MVFLVLWSNLLKLPSKIVIIELSRVEGFSLNYFAFSFTGYTYYTIYLTLGRFTDIKGAGTVVIADLIFIYHTVIMIIIQLIQCITYDVSYCYNLERNKQTIEEYYYHNIITHSFYYSRSNLGNYWGYLIS